MSPALTLAFLAVIFACWGSYLAHSALIPDDVMLILADPVLILADPVLVLAPVRHR